MTDLAVTPYRSPLPIGRERFHQLVLAEWTKLRSVRAWRIGLLVAVLLIVGIGILGSSGSSSSINGVTGHPFVPLGPGGEAVSDSFYFVQQPLPQDATITARVVSLVGTSIPNSGGVCGQGPQTPCPVGPAPTTRNGRIAAQPWAKAGLIVAASDAPGAAYAAVMATPDHGVRMQWDYTNDVPGIPLPPVAAGGGTGTVAPFGPRWLRLTRSGDVVTGYESVNGSSWTEIDSVVLAGLPAAAEVGLFVASPQVTVIQTHFGGQSGSISPSLATARFDHLALAYGAGSHTAWHGVAIGAGANGSYPSAGGDYRAAAGVFTVQGSGDIAPEVAGPAGNGLLLEQTLVGAFAGLVALIVLGTVFITGEFRRGLIRTTLSASPRRGRVLAAKAIVLGAVSFVAGLVASTVSLTVGQSLLNAHGNFVYPVAVPTEVRMVVGISLVLAVGAILALAMGTILRRGAGVIAGLIALFVLPEFLSQGGVLPAGLSEWLLRITPAAGFAVLQSLPQYAQVSNLYSPQNGYYPLLWWAGLLVLCAYRAAAMGLATYLLGRRDA